MSCVCAHLVSAPHQRSNRTDARLSTYSEDPERFGGQYPAPRRGPSWLLIAGLVMLVVAIGSGAYVVYDNRLSFLPPAAPTVTRPPATALALAAPSPTLTSPSDGPSVPPPTTGPLATPDPGALFAATITDRNLSDHVDAAVVVREGSQKLTISVALDQDGADLAAVLSVKTNIPGLRSNKAHVVVKNGVAYAKDGRHKWVRSSDPSVLDTMNGVAFSGFDLGHIEYVGPETHGGKALQHIRLATVPSLTFDTTAMQQLGCPTTGFQMDLWVRDDGTPVSGTMSYSCSPAQGAKATISVTYEWSKVGQPIDIKVPAKFR